MDYRAFLSTLDREGTLLAQAASRSGWAAKVPSCPEWTTRDLVQHIGQVHRWAGEHVRNRRSEDDVELADAPGGDDLLAWYADGHTGLVAALREAGPNSPAWRFLPAPSGSGFWARRQAHETTIHRVDAELAAGGPLSAIDPDFAADGVDELLAAFYARRPSRMTAAVPFSFGLVATDMDRSWRTVVGEDGPETTVLNGPVDIIVTASAPDLYLLVWNRLDHRDLPAHGDRTVLDRWRDRAHIRWS